MIDSSVVCHFEFARLLSSSSLRADTFEFFSDLALSLQLIHEDERVP